MEFLSNFSERLTELMFDYKLDAKQLSKVIDVSSCSINKWKRKPTAIKRINLIKLADYFCCSIDYLVGRKPYPDTVTPKPCPPFGQQVRKAMYKKGFTTHSLRKVSRFESIYFQYWDKGSEPSLSILIELAEIFDCTIDFLVGREN